MAPSEYSLRLQKGITGGFAPPTPSFIATITRPVDSDTLNITSASRPSGTPDLQSFAPKTLALGTVEVTALGSVSVEGLIDELHGILKELPTEEPRGSEDIYGLDTSIFWGSEDLQWMNGGMGGVTGQPGSSTVQPTPEQKAQFKRAVEIVEALVGEAK
ncbi:uncharacterized protein C8R40DRAFT_1072486 [Lentinula edodes]|uniref:uncharacterized protein n=1 Tax=Lentinula edodes TaxID=5353 RepID=UPI001E8E58F9|nr:uncharacterized protein C8R40DRAFT_1072486 [Lentinula edodes]KAH7871429.1 hypothetical protein C8R40DRAFT_1072486 [Lentinula edodes]